MVDAATGTVIEATTNIADQVWTPISTNLTSASGAIQFIDSAASDMPQRFYRARMLR